MSVRMGRTFDVGFAVLERSLSKGALSLACLLAFLGRVARPLLLPDATRERTVLVAAALALSSSEVLDQANASLSLRKIFTSGWLGGRKPRWLADPR